MDFFKLIHGFVKIDTQISLSCYKLLYGFVKIHSWISLSGYVDLSKLQD